MEEAKRKIQECLQNEPPFCTVTCPFRLDVRDFIGKMQRGGFNAAYRSYLNTVGFPGIVTALCDEPCKIVCPRREKDNAISLRLLEKAALDYARNPYPNNYNIPPKNKKIAVIGAGISGLACALRLASKKYEVSVFERSDRIGGHLWDLLPSEVFLKDIERQFMYENYNLVLGTEITCLEDLDFDAFYIATGKGGNNFGLLSDPNGAFASKTLGVFLGGSLTDRTSMEAIADGLHASIAIERYIKIGSMNQPYDTACTKLSLDPETISPTKAVLPADGIAFTREEAILESNRCLKCSCDACMRYCDLMRFYKKYPKRIAEEVELTIHPGTLDGNGTLATRLISTCNQCGLCKEVCPIEIDTGDFLLQNHRIMREKNAMPWAFHDFFLQDMAFSNSEFAHLSRRPPRFDHSRYMFFPGCQLGASDPQYVIAGYRWLLSQKPDTALLLNCCGAPAEWSGDEAIHSEVTTKLKEDWISLGKPIAVFACPTCRQMFQRYLPEVESVFLYDLILKWGGTPVREGHGEIVSIFDPCSSREEPGLQQTIRQLVNRSGFQNIPLPLEGKLAACCSWGGQVSVANPNYAGQVVAARINQNDNPYVAYCINCRDIFASAQKSVYHILDILFGLHGSDRKPPTLTQRRENREKLKRQILGEFWEDVTNMELENKSKNLQITPQIRQKISDELILETDIESVIDHCENSGSKVRDTQSGHFFGHLQIGNMTYWVEYLPTETGYVVFNAYCHRMSIDKA